jgi:glyoxylase-like metal-dependent hydrolase (beta-lactamase superfamily II)
MQEGEGMKIGTYELTGIETGTFALDGGAMFGVVPKPLWEKYHPADSRNRIRMTARALLVRGEGRTILVDTGNGDKFDAKFKEIYALDESGASLLTSLRQHGVAPEDVTDVVLTHLHFDHAGGGTQRTASGVEPTFPRARYHVQRAHRDAALQPTERDRASFMADDLQPLVKREQLVLVDGEKELFPGFRVITMFGHTTALQCPVISDGTTTLLYCADLVPLHSHCQLPWIMGYDLRPLVTLEEKRSILQRAADEQWVMFFEHDPDVVAGTVGRTDKGYRFNEAVRL